MAITMHAAADPIYPSVNPLAEIVAPIPPISTIEREEDREDTFASLSIWLWEVAQYGSSKLAEGRLHSDGRAITAETAIAAALALIAPEDRVEVARLAVEGAEDDIEQRLDEHRRRQQAFGALSSSLRKGCPVTAGLAAVPKERWLPQSHWVPKDDGSGAYVCVWTGIEVRCDEQGRVWPGPTGGPLTREAIPPTCSPFEFDDEMWGRS